MSDCIFDAYRKCKREKYLKYEYYRYNQMSASENARTLFFK